MADEFGEHIRGIAAEFIYPAMQSEQNKILFLYQGQFLRRMAIVLVVIGLAGFAIPDIRAKVFEILRIGAVTITLDGSDSSGGTLHLEDVYGETDLADAQSRISFDLMIPADDLPDKVYLQDDELVIFLWLDDKEIIQALYQVLDIDWAIFKTVDAVTQTIVNQENAYWLDIQHPVQFRNGETELTYFVNGNVLIWTDGTVTYRLETTLDMASARLFAEGLVNSSP